MEAKIDKKLGTVTIVCETIPDRLMCEGALKMGIPLQLVGPKGVPDSSFVQDEVLRSMPESLIEIPPPAPAKKKRRKKKEVVEKPPVRMEDSGGHREGDGREQIPVQEPEKPPEMTIFEQVVDLAKQLMNSVGDDNEEMKNQIFIELQVVGAVNTSALKKLSEKDHAIVLEGLKKLKASKENFDK